MVSPSFYMSPFHIKYLAFIAYESFGQRLSAIAGFFFQNTDQFIGNLIYSLDVYLYGPKDKTRPVNCSNWRGQ